MVEMSKHVPEKRSETLKSNVEDSKKPVTSPKSRAERAANQAAHKAARTQQEYEKDQTTISK
jgi:hypothetical protein